MIFRGKSHEKLFDHESWLRPVGNNRLTAALYLLTADNKLWEQVQDAVAIHTIHVEDMRPKELSPAGYIFFRMAKDILRSEETVGIASMVNPASISQVDFLVICTALFLCAYGRAAADKLNIRR